MMVLMALRPAPMWTAVEQSKRTPSRRAACGRCSARAALAAELSVPDGGWAAFDKDVTQRWLEDVPFADHNAILDPTCSDLTGRVAGVARATSVSTAQRQPRPRARLNSSKRTQEADGSWYGRWGVNYIYGTWQVLRGLRAIGEDMRQPWIVRARDWLESCQNEDGGWGETCASYDDPTLKAKVRARRRRPPGRSWASSRRPIPRAPPRSMGDHPPRHFLFAQSAKRRRLLARTARRPAPDFPACFI